MKFSQWTGFAVLVLSLYILWHIRQLVLLLLTAVILANALNLLVKQFQRWGIQRSYAVVLSMLSLLVSLVAFFWLFIPPLLNQIQELIELVPQGIDLLIVWIDYLSAKLSPALLKSFPDITLSEVTQQLHPLVHELLGGGLNIFYSSLGIVLSLLLLFVLTLMLLADPRPYRRGFIRLFPSFYRARVERILQLSEQSLQQWLLEALCHMGMVTLLSLIGLWLLGIHLALSQAMLAGILAFIPYIGPGLSAIPPAAIALLDSPGKAFIVLLLYAGIQPLEGLWFKTLDDQETRLFTACDRFISPGVFRQHFWISRSLFGSSLNHCWSHLGPRNVD